MGGDHLKKKIYIDTSIDTKNLKNLEFEYNMAY